MSPISRKTEKKKQENEWRRALAQAFEAPAPLRKAQFFRQAAPVPSCSGNLFFTQLCYIRKRIWGISALLFAVSLAASLLLSVDILWSASALAPFLALMMVAETGRSKRYGMTELEMATRFSLRRVLLARLFLLGTGNLLLLGVFVPLSLAGGQTPPLQAGLGIATPFLLTTFLCLHVVRRHRGGDDIYLCAGISACVSILVPVSRRSLPWLYGDASLTGRGIACALLIVCIVKQYHILLCQEDLTWNLS